MAHGSWFMCAGVFRPFHKVGILRTVFWPAVGRRLGLPDEIDCALDRDILLHAPDATPAVHAPRDFGIDGPERGGEEEPDREHDDRRDDPRGDAGVDVEALAAEEQRIDGDIPEEDDKNAGYAPRPGIVGEYGPEDDAPEHVLLLEHLPHLVLPALVPARHPVLQDGLDHHVVPRAGLLLGVLERPHLVLRAFESRQAIKSNQNIFTRAIMISATRGLSRGPHLLRVGHLGR